MLPEEQGAADRVHWQCYACNPLTHARPAAACYSPTCRAIGARLATDLSARARFYLGVLELKQALGVARAGPEELFECAVRRAVPEALWGKFLARALEHGVPELDAG